jgi:hypothetical protein
LKLVSLTYPTLFVLAEVKGDAKVEFECKAKTEDAVTEVKDKIEFKVSFDEDGLKVKVEYEQEIETEELETETETKYEVLFDRVIEYAKLETPGSTEDAAYDWEADLIVSEILLTDLGGFSEVVTTDDDTYTFSIATTDGVAMFTFTISQGGANEALTANKMKIDFELIGYPWIRTDTYVALLSTVESEKEIEIEYEDDSKKYSEDVLISFGEAIEGTGIVPFGEYTWVKDAQVLGINALGNETSGNQTIGLMQGVAEDTVTIQVVATTPSDGTDRLAFSFVGSAAQTASDIYWDPETGIGYSSWAVTHTATLVGVLMSSVAAALFQLW